MNAESALRALARLLAMVWVLSLTGCATRPPDAPKDQLDSVVITTVHPDETPGQDTKALTLTIKDIDVLLRTVWSKDTFELMRKSVFPQDRLKFWMFMQSIVVRVDGTCDRYALMAISPSGADSSGAPAERWDIDSCGKRASFRLALVGGDVQATTLPAAQVM